MNCRTSDEVQLLLRNRDGCKFRGQFPYPRLITAMDHNQKEFVAHTNVQQVLERAWIGDWIEWKAYSTFRKGLYVLWCLVLLPITILFGVFVPDSALNKSNRLPINRMFNSLVTYLIFLALLFVQSNSDKFTTPRGAPYSITWWCVSLFVVGHVVEKIKLRMLQGPERFFKNLWNGFDTAKLTLFTTAYLCWALAEVQTNWVNVELDRKYWHWADPQLLAEGLFAVATVMAYMRLLFLCQLNYYIGPMQVSLGKVLHDFVKFSTFMVIIMAAFTSGMGTLYSYYAGMVHKDPDTGLVTQQENSFISISDTFKTLYWGIFCMTSLDAPNVIVDNHCDPLITGAECPETYSHTFTELVGYGLFAVFQVLMVIVMLNMLIAAMSDTFQRVADNAEYEWLFGRTEVYVNYMLLGDIPPPFNLLPTFRWITNAKNIASKTSGYKAVEDDQNSTAFRALMAKLIQRYFTWKVMVDRSS